MNCVMKMKMKFKFLFLKMYFDSLNFIIIELYCISRYKNSKDKR